MQLQVGERWQYLWRWAASAPAPLIARMLARRNEMLLSVLLAAFFVLGGGASVRAALVGLVAVVCWAMIWPVDVARIRSSALAQPAIDSDKLWRMVVDAVPEPAVVLNASADIMHANRLAEQLFGTRRRGGHLATMSRDPELLSAVDRALASRQTNVVELHGRVPVERRLLVTIAPLGQFGGALGVPALLISFRDLTEEDRLARMRADFVANASHELRTPLASLKGFVETLQGAAKDDPKARERFLGVMSEQAERMTRLIDDLLSLSRVEMREHLPPVDRVDLNEAVTHVIQTMQPLAAKSGAVIELYSLDTPATIRGDRDEVVQLFQNLIQNAIKYGKPGGRIEVHMERKSSGPGRPDQILVSVIDDGPGIAPQHLPRLTERFYRVSVAASREKGGTGLGLAIVKHILNRHGGELAVTSKLGQGSTFTVALPGTQD
jgi:two-component system phosphate regulon sensor histidine kinase PhoR